MEKNGTNSFGLESIKVSSPEELGIKTDLPDLRPSADTNLTEDLGLKKPLDLRPSADTNGIIKFDDDGKIVFNNNLTNKGYPSSKEGYINKISNVNNNLTDNGYSSSKEGYTNKLSNSNNNLTDNGYPNSKEGYISDDNGNNIISLNSIGWEDIDFSKISTNHQDAMNGNFIDESKIRKEYWKDGNLELREESDGVIAIYKDGVPMGRTTLDALKNKYNENHHDDHYNYANNSTGMPEKAHDDHYNYVNNSTGMPERYYENKGSQGGSSTSNTNYYDNPEELKKIFGDDGTSSQKYQDFMNDPIIRQANENLNNTFGNN